MAQAVSTADIDAAAAPPAPFHIPSPIVPPARPLNRLAFISRFLRNPLLILPQAVYEQDVVAAPGRLPIVWITDPDLIKSVLLDQRDAFGKTVQIRILGPLLGKGILTSEGAEWKWQRQTSAPMFRHGELMTFVPTFVRCTQSLIAAWRNAPNGSVREIEHDMTNVTFDVISATLLPSADATVGPAVEASTGRFQKAGAWSLLYAIAGAPKWLPRPHRRTQREAIDLLRSSVAAMLREREAAPAGRDDLMRRLMTATNPETGRPMTETQLIDNLLTFYLAGHDTTAKALTWTLFLLARSPEWTAALKDEIARVTGGGAVTAEHIDKLVLTQQVIKESMRLYPPVPVMSRQALTDTRLGDQSLKAGASVVIPIWALHRHRRRWPEPDLFDPMRFAPDKERHLSRYQYMPFGAGPRICIGMAFAMIEATAMLATMLQAARFEPGGGAHPMPVARVTLVPKGGMQLKVWCD
jgi:cytochrome P450